MLDLHRAVRAAWERKVLVMAHFSHAYPEGCSIYFTFVGSTLDPERAREGYLRLWSEALGAVTRAGGTISLPP